MSETRPCIICHMAATIDGKIDGSALQGIMRHGEYESLHSRLGGNAWICGRTTMQQHFADDEPFVSATNAPAGPQPVHVARRSSRGVLCNLSGHDGQAQVVEQRSVWRSPDLRCERACPDRLPCDVAREANLLRCSWRLCC